MHIQIVAKNLIRAYQAEVRQVNQKNHPKILIKNQLAQKIVKEHHQ